MARRAQNFKNITSTLTERHQYLQAYYSAGNLYQLGIFYGELVRFSDILYSDNIVKCVRLVIPATDDCYVATDVMCKNVTYKADMHVIIDHPKDRGIMFGKIVLVLSSVSQAEPYVVVEKETSEYERSYGVYRLTPTNEFICIRIDSLADYYPLQSYAMFAGNRVVVLKHAIATL